MKWLGLLIGHTNLDFKMMKRGLLCMEYPSGRRGPGLFPEFEEDTILVTMATREQAKDKACKDKSCLKNTIRRSKYVIIPSTLIHPQY